MVVVLHLWLMGLGDGTFNLPQKPDSSTNVQLTTIAPHEVGDYLETWFKHSFKPIDKIKIEFEND